MIFVCNIERFVELCIIIRGGREIGIRAMWQVRKKPSQVASFLESSTDPHRIYLTQSKKYMLNHTVL